MNEYDFIKHFVANSNHLMWFLGAGTSRTAGMPTAIDLIWDLKLKFYCREENQDIKSHDINNEHIKQRIQSYMDSRGFPPLWSPEEYSFYFELSFGTDYDAQQKYLLTALGREKISLNIGHRTLAALIKLNRTRIIYTTNFDEVIETACARVSSIPIPTYNLEGSYAALDALNAEIFPIYAKIHGDFKYRSVKNLSQDLINNDIEIQKCFIAAASRYGLIVTGYSGRDKNVMSMFAQAIEQHNAFPAGLFWTVPNINKVEENVKSLIETAQKKGLKAFIIETGTFDSMLSRIWRQIPERDEQIDKMVNTAKANPVNIPLGSVGSSFPVIRTNALPITLLPNQSAIISTKRELSGRDVKDLLHKNPSNTIILRADNLLAWGQETEMIKALEEGNIEKISSHTIENPSELVCTSTVYRAFYERAIVVALCDKRPILLKNDYGFVLTMNSSGVNNKLFQPLKEALPDRSGNPGYITGNVLGSRNVTWSEAVRIKLENRNGELFIMLNPTIWIEPSIERRNHIEFIKSKRKYRYNQSANRILDAWINVLFGSLGKPEVEFIFEKDSQYPALFKINTRTVYSRK